MSSYNRADSVLCRSSPDPSRQRRCFHVTSVVTALEMDKNQDVSRLSPATKRHLHEPPPASEKSRKERFQKLSLVGTRVNPKIEMVSDQEDEQIISMLAAKRFKLPQKFMEEDHASVPRKLRSAMKKRNAGTLSPPLQDPKKTKLHLRGRYSPQTDPVKKIKKQKRMDRAKPTRASGSITKDEEEVVETLYALAGLIGTVADESSQDPISTVNEAMESPKLEGKNAVTLHEEAAEVMNSKPKPEEQTNMPIEIIADSRPTPTNPEQQPKPEDNCASLSQPKVPVLWPGLLTASRNSFPPRIHARSSSNHESAESCYSTAKICKNTVGKVSRKKCTGHVYISRLIRTLQNPDSKGGLSSQDGTEAAAKHGIVNVGPGFAVLQNVRNGDVSTDLHQKRNGNCNGQLSGSYVAQMNRSEKQCFDFLSLSNRSGTTTMSLFQSPPYLPSYPQQHVPTTHPDHKIHYSDSYPDQLSTISSQQVVPPYHCLVQSSLQMGPTREHRQAVWPVPGSHGGVESSGSMQELMTQYNHHHQQQQQLHQYMSLRSSMSGRQDHVVGLSSVVREETGLRFHRGNSLSLQLLCNERL